MKKVPVSMNHSQPGLRPPLQLMNFINPMKPLMNLYRIFRTTVRDKPVPAPPKGGSWSRLQFFHTIIRIFKTSPSAAP